MTHHEQFQDYHRMLAFLTVFKEAAVSKAKSVVFDMRLKYGPNINTNSAAFRFMFSEALKIIVTKPIHLPTYRG